jgi:hypothetical protein
LYRAYLAQSDVFVGLYWRRYGRVGSGMEHSSLEEELQLARSQGMPRLYLEELLARCRGVAILTTSSTQLVTLCLAGFAQLTFVEGNAEQAALLAGAAEGLRRRVGLRAWPSHRRAEAALVDQIRQALGVDRFDQAFAAGARLNRREAVAVVHDRLGGSVTAP